MPLLSVQNVSKRFGSLSALGGVSAEFRPGEIHAVLGENGAGKSTLMNVLSGFVKPDSGTVLLDGVRIPVGHAHHCKRIGIEMIHQHFSLVPEFTVGENLALARLDGLAKLADTDQLAKSALDEAASLGWSIDAQARTGRLPVGVQQRIEILKAVAGRASVLIFDEPTAVLSPDEIDDLFRVLRRLKEEGKVVILIAHKLSEVLTIADRVTVLRRGKFIATALRSEVDSAILANWMVGDMPVKGHSDRPSGTRIGLLVKDLTVLGDRNETAINGIAFEIAQGQVLGFGGVDGNGQVELAECLSQIRKPASGTITWEGQPFSREVPHTGYVPQDRQTDGLALGMSIQDNMLVSGLDREELFKGPFVKNRAVRDWAKSLVDRYSVKVESISDLAGSLSGGNQQKVVVSRVLDGKPRLLVVVNPGRGLDIKATQYVHERILEARNAGAAVALFSADLDELFELSDRTVFLSRGRLVEGSSAGALVGES